MSPQRSHHLQAHVSPDSPSPLTSPCIPECQTPRLASPATIQENTQVSEKVKAEKLSPTLSPSPLVSLSPHDLTQLKSDHMWRTSPESPDHKPSVHNTRHEKNVAIEVRDRHLTFARTDRKFVTPSITSPSLYSHSSTKHAHGPASELIDLPPRPPRGFWENTPKLPQSYQNPERSSNLSLPRIKTCPSSPTSSPSREAISTSGEQLEGPKRLLVREWYPTPVSLERSTPTRPHPHRWDLPRASHHQQAIPPPHEMAAPAGLTRLREYNASSNMHKDHRDGKIEYHSPKSPSVEFQRNRWLHPIQSRPKSDNNTHRPRLAIHPYLPPSSSLEQLPRFYSAGPSSIRPRPNGWFNQRHQRIASQPIGQVSPDLSRGHSHGHGPESLHMSRYSSPTSSILSPSRAADLLRLGPRKRADEEQLSILQEVFERTSYPSTEEREDLARKLGMTSRSVQIWFQNRRRAVKVEQQSAKQRAEAEVVVAGTPYF